MDAKSIGILIIKAERCPDDDDNDNADDSYQFWEDGRGLLLASAHSKEMMSYSDTAFVVKTDEDLRLSESILSVPLIDPLFITDIKQETEDSSDFFVPTNIEMDIDVGETIQWKNEVPDLVTEPEEEEEMDLGDKETDWIYQEQEEESEEGDDPEFDPKEKLQKTDYFHRRINTRLNKMLNQNRTLEAAYHAVIGKGLHLCQYCLDSKFSVLLKFKSVDALNEHVLAVHKKKYTFRCEECSKTYLKKEALRAHIRSTPNCKEAHQRRNAVVTTKPASLRHGVLKSEVTGSDQKQKWACLCGKSYALASSLRSHVWHAQRKEAGVRDQCQFCRSEDLRTHVESLHQGKTLNCPKCGGIFKQKKSLSRHLRLRCKAN